MRMNGISYSLMINRVLRTANLNCLMPCLYFIFIAMHTTPIAVNTLMAVMGIYSNCNTKGINEKMAIPDSKHRGIKSAGFILILHSVSSPKPDNACTVVNNRIVSRLVIMRLDIF
jgi:hypothetical protein